MLLMGIVMTETVSGVSPSNTSKQWWLKRKCLSKPYPMITFLWPTWIHWQWWDRHYSTSSIDDVFREWSHLVIEGHRSLKFVQTIIDVNSLLVRNLFISLLGKCIDTVSIIRPGLILDQSVSSVISTDSLSDALYQVKVRYQQSESRNWLGWPGLAFRPEASLTFRQL